MDETLNQPVATGAVKQSTSFNKITAVKYLIRSVFYLALFLGGYGLGIVMGTGQLASMKAKQGVVIGQDFIKPVFTGVTFQGTLKSRNANTVVLEKDGVELMLNIEGEVKVFDVKSTDAPGNKKIEDVPIGTDLRGSAIFKKDEKTGKNNLFVNTFLIN